LLSFVCRTRTLQDCSDRVLAEPDMAADQPVAQTSICQLEDLRRLVVRWTLSWLAAEPLTAGLGGGDAGLDALAIRSRSNSASAAITEAIILPCGVDRSNCRPDLRRRGRTHPTPAATVASARGRWCYVPSGRGRGSRLLSGSARQGVRRSAENSEKVKKNSPLSTNGAHYTMFIPDAVRESMTVR
jgi:hypothetical protein